MDPTKFDDFTKVLVISTSRRQVLRRIGGTLTGALLVALFPGRTLADDNGDCADFCNAVFGENSRAAHQCINDATHNKGLCYKCGPENSDDYYNDYGRDICCPRNNGSGYCTGYSTATCCGDHESCINGRCWDKCEGQPCGLLEFGCNGNSDCVCYQTVEGDGFCSYPPICTNLTFCTRTSDCQAGWACAVTCCVTGGIAQPTCVQGCPPGPRVSLSRGQTTIGNL